jgi:hypothetical protein
LILADAAYFNENYFFVQRSLIGIIFFAGAGWGGSTSLRLLVNRDGGKEAKFWLTPEIRVAYNDGFDARTQRVLLAMIAANRDLIMRKWDEFFA